MANKQPYHLDSKQITDTTVTLNESKKASYVTNLYNIRNLPKDIEIIRPKRRKIYKTSQDSFYIGIASLETKVKSIKENEAPSDW